MVCTLGLAGSDEGDSNWMNKKRDYRIANSRLKRMSCGLEHISTALSAETHTNPLEVHANVSFAAT